MNDTILILVLMSLTGGLGTVVGFAFGAFAGRQKVIAV